MSDPFFYLYNKNDAHCLMCVHAGPSGQPGAAGDPAPWAGGSSVFALLQEEVPKPRHAAGAAALTGALQEGPVKKEKKQKKEKKVSEGTAHLPGGMCGVRDLDFRLFMSNASRRVKRRRARKRRSGRLMRR